MEHGVVDEARQRKPSYSVWKEMNAPAQIDAQWIRSANAGVTGFSAGVAPNAEQDLPYYRLHGYVLAWSLLDEKGVAVAGAEHRYDDLIHAEQLTGSLPAQPAGHALRLMVKLLSPAGDVAAERMLEWPASPAPK